MHDGPRLNPVLDTSKPLHEAFEQYFAKPAPAPKPPNKKPDRATRRRMSKADQQWHAKAVFQNPPAQEQETWFRHTNWRVKRAKVRTAMIAAAVTRGALERFDECGADAFVEYCKATERFRVRANYCKCRHCEPCQRAKANKLAANLRNRLEERPEGSYRFITLTLKHNAKPLADEIHRIYECFKRLRNTVMWKDTQHGGASILEVKFNPKGHDGTEQLHPWHVHLHIVTEGDYLQQRDLANTWKDITGDSFIVDIRTLASGKDAAHYLAKYVAKGTNDDVWNHPDAATEWVIALKGVRSAGTFGTWRGFKLLDIPEDTDEWEAIGTLSKIVDQARKGIPYYVGILRNLTDNVQYDPHRKRKLKDEPPK